jgi:hypothetical protein
LLVADITLASDLFEAGAIDDCDFAAAVADYYTPDGKLIYAGRAGTGMPERELERLWRRLTRLAVDTMPLDAPPPRGGRFGSPLVLSRVHWVRPEMVVEVSYVEWTDDGLLRHVVYLGEREDKLARDVVRSLPYCPGAPHGVFYDPGSTSLTANTPFPALSISSFLNASVATGWHSRSSEITIGGNRYPSNR